MKSFLKNDFLLFLLFETIFNFGDLSASNGVIPISQNDSVRFVVYSGLVTNQETGKPLAFASIILKGTNISTVSNTEGAFILKVPKDQLKGNLEFSFLGFHTKIVPLTNLNTELFNAELEPMLLVLPEVNVVFNDALSLVRAVIKNKGTNYLDEPANLTAFYRETIKKRKTYVSLLEAVVDIYKYPYYSDKTDWVSLYKVRKSTDYQKLDTLAFKLMGGPYNTLMTDVMKNTDEFFSSDIMGYYTFSFEGITNIGDKSIYVVSFKQLPTYPEPLYFGKLYIDAERLALVSAEFGLNVENRDAAAEIFIKKKPINARVFPTRNMCRVDYIQRGGKWYLNYCRVELDVYIDWKRKFFKTIYYSTMEMAVTDMKIIKKEESTIDTKNRMKISTIIADEARGFADPDFWGEYNVIEPEKPIQSAIKKIQKQLKKNSR